MRPRPSSVRTPSGASNSVSCVTFQCRIPTKSGLHSCGRTSSVGHPLNATIGRMHPQHVIRSAALALVLFASVASAQGPPREQTLAQAFDGQVSMIEREVLGLAMKMPADKYNFAPATGTPPAGRFDGVRTFGVQVRHLATVMYDLSSQI